VLVEGENDGMSAGCAVAMLTEVELRSFESRFILIPKLKSKRIFALIKKLVGLSGFVFTAWRAEFLTFQLYLVCLTILSLNFSCKSVIAVAVSLHVL